MELERGSGPTELEVVAAGDRCSRRRSWMVSSLMFSLHLPPPEFMFFGFNSTKRYFIVVHQMKSPIASGLSRVVARQCATHGFARCLNRLMARLRDSAYNYTGL